jgi:hypothetical protein
LTSLTVDSHELRFDEAFLIHAGEVPAFVPQTDASGDLPVPAVSDFLDLSETRQRGRDHENQPWGIEVRDKALPDFLKGDMGEREYDALMRLEAGARLGGGGGGPGLGSRDRPQEMYYYNGEALGYAFRGCSALTLR